MPPTYSTISGVWIFLRFRRSMRECENAIMHEWKKNEKYRYDLKKGAKLLFSNEFNLMVVLKKLINPGALCFREIDCCFKRCNAPLTGSSYT